MSKLIAISLVTALGNYEVKAELLGFRSTNTTSRQIRFGLKLTF